MTTKKTSGQSVKDTTVAAKSKTKTSSSKVSVAAGSTEGTPDKPKESSAKHFSIEKYRRDMLVGIGCPAGKVDEVCAEATSIVDKAIAPEVLESRRRRNYTEKLYPYYLPSKHVHKMTLRIALRGIKPPVWRKVEVPSNISLRHLAELIIEVMGWGHEHLYQFILGDEYIIPYYFKEEGLEGDYLQEEVSLDKAMSFRNKIVFEYDFGDSWEHDVTLTDYGEYEEDEPRLIRFKGGKRACPPENCGGVWGYQDLLEAMARVKAGNPEGDDEEKLEWYFDDGEGGLDDCDPEEFWYSDNQAKSFSSRERETAIFSTAMDIVLMRYEKKKKS